MSSSFMYQLDAVPNGWASHILYTILNFNSAQWLQSRYYSNNSMLVRGTERPGFGWTANVACHLHASDYN